MGKTEGVQGWAGPKRRASFTCIRECSSSVLLTGKMEIVSKIFKIRCTKETHLQKVVHNTLNAGIICGGTTLVLYIMKQCMQVTVLIEGSIWLLWFKSVLNVFLFGVGQISDHIV